MQGGDGVKAGEVRVAYCKLADFGEGGGVACGREQVRGIARIGLDPMGGSEVYT